MASSPSSVLSVEAEQWAEPDGLSGSTLPRIWTPPLVVGPAGPCGCGCALTPETSLGFEVAVFASNVLGLVLLPWQRWLLIHALEMRADGSFRFRTVVVLVGRQNGKSTVLQILSLWMMYLFGVKLVIGTAQNLDVAEEVWQGAVEIAKAVPELAEEIDKVVQINGKKSLNLIGGHRYKVAAASRRGGRGLAGDLVLLDELREHQSWDAWAAVTKTTMARALAMVWAASNAGDAASIVLRWLRKMAHLAIGDPDGLGDADDVTAGDDIEDVDDATLGIFEWSAEPGCSIFDRDGWCQANPGLGYTITERAILSAAKTDPEWVFRTEVLCQWLDSTSDGPFPADAWTGCADPESQIAEDSPLVWCVDVSWDRTVAHIAVAGWREDRRPHVEIVASRVGTDWVTAWFADPTHPDRLKPPVAVQAKRAPATDLIEDLKAVGVEVIGWDGVEGTGELYDHVRAAVGDGDSRVLLAHRAQPVLDQAANTAATRPVGDMWAWDRRKSPADAAPLVAATGALWCLKAQSKPKKRSGEARF